MIKSEINWIDCKERLPNTDGKEGCEFLVIIKEEGINKGGWDYGIDLAWFGTYIDDFWDTCNDWCEGQEVHVTHWATIDVPSELLEKEGK